ncbi:MAG: polysaccharide biosynthesis/export family protein [Bacteroidales bacterium]|nr:polysaccharide biosynthesis/export family protein [Bacteroidales bacterium]
MSKRGLVAVAAAAVLLAAGCRTQQEPYISDAPRNTPTELPARTPVTLAPGDEVYIHVSSRTPESVIRFNRETNALGASEHRLGYLVSAGGYIHFPELGLIEVNGMTLTELEREVGRLLRQGTYVSDPVVTAQLMNFHVTVIGEVARPRVVPGKSTRLTLFEALAYCGDITPFGLATNVVVVREVEEGQRVDTVDLTRKEVFQSPCYYLQQNDIVYVEPNDLKKKQSYRETDWLRYMTSGVSLLNVAWRTIYQIQRTR